jgi:hypothetical protein
VIAKTDTERIAAPRTRPRTSRSLRGSGADVDAAREGGQRLGPKVPGEELAGRGGHRDEGDPDQPGGDDEDEEGGAPDEGQGAGALGEREPQAREEDPRRLGGEGDPNGHRERLVLPERRERDDEHRHGERARVPREPCGERPRAKRGDADPAEEHGHEHAGHHPDALGEGEQVVHTVVAETAVGGQERRTNEGRRRDGRTRDPSH